MKTNATLSLAFKDSDARRGLASILGPDNEGAPLGLEISMEEQGKTMKIRVKSESPSDALSTVLALLRDIALFEVVWLLSRTQRA